VVLLGAEPARMEPGMELSPEAERALRPLVEMVRGEVFE